MYIKLYSLFSLYVLYLNFILVLCFCIVKFFVIGSTCENTYCYLCCSFL